MTREQVISRVTLVGSVVNLLLVDSHIIVHMEPMK